MPRFLDRLLQLGPSDDPRSVPVGRSAGVQQLELTSTPGARVRIRRDGRDAAAQLAVLWCVRNRVPVELCDGPPAVLLDGAAVSPEELMRRLTR